MPECGELRERALRVREGVLSLQKLSARLALVLLVAGGLIAFPALSPGLTGAAQTGRAAAQEQQDRDEADEVLRGRLRFEGEPIEGTLITAAVGDQTVGEAVSAGDGEWEIPLPGPGTYRVTLHEDTLPEGVGLRDPERATLEFDVRPGRGRTVLFALGEPEGLAARLIPQVAQAAVNGVKFGLIIAMTAIGLSLVFGTTRLVNFAHGDMVTFGAVVAFYLNTAGMHLIPAAMVAIAAGSGLGAGLERGLWNPLRARKTGIIQLFVISIGLAMLIRHTILLVMGGRPRPYVDYTVQTPLALGPILVTPRDLAVMGLSVVILVAVGLMLLRTRLGKAMRAVSDNRDLAESSGINVKAVILLVWITAGGLAAMGGVLLGVVENVDWLMGFRALLLMFAAVILGGLGTAFGAMAGGLVVGLVTELSAVWQPAELKFMWALLALILVLMFRPQGIFGRRERIG